MPTPAQDLLALRISTLRSDVEKVRHAVELAERRNAQMAAISDVVESSSKAAYEGLAELNDVINQLRGFVRLNPLVEDALSESLVGVAADGTEVQLLDLVNGMSAQVEGIRSQVDAPRRPLVRVVRAQVDLKDRTGQLERSLDTRCRVLTTALDDLAARTAAGAPRELWSAFDTLLHEQARPLFVEYVDFLGGLTVRETGLDGRICEMSEFLLGGLASTRFVSIPASQSALSSAMDSVIKMGFPEWSVWGLPLAAHEVGVALWDDPMITDLRAAIREQVPAECDDAELAELFGDAFAAWTMGPAYGCAALLLRLQPHGADVRAHARPRDVDRARLVLGVLRSLTPPASDDGLSAAVETLASLWERTTRTLAPVTTAGGGGGDGGGVGGEEPGGAGADAAHEDDGLDARVAAAVQALHDADVTSAPLTPEQWQAVETLASLRERATRALAPAPLAGGGTGGAAPAEAGVPGGAGAAPGDDWVDALVTAAVQALRDVRLTYPPLTVEQWQAVEERRGDLARAPGDGPEPVVPARPETLLELLNAAWVARLEGDAGPDVLAAAVTRMWQHRSTGTSGLGTSGTGSSLPHRIGAGRQ